MLNQATSRQRSDFKVLPPARQNRPPESYATRASIPPEPVEDKIKTITEKIYGASVVEYSPRAKSQIQLMKKLGFDQLPICIAKTPMSFSDDEKKIGRPEGFTVTVREFEYAAGAGFIVPLLGDVMRMPGLPAIPNAEKIDVTDDGVVSGLF